MHAAHDPTETTAAARAAFLSKFELQVDPDGILPEGERQRRAEHAKKAYFARLALRSARARGRKNSRKSETAESKSAVAATGGISDGASSLMPPVAATVDLLSAVSLFLEFLRPRARADLNAKRAK